MNLKTVLAFVALSIGTVPLASNPIKNFPITATATAATALSGTIMLISMYNSYVRHCHLHETTPKKFLEFLHLKLFTHQDPTLGEPTLRDFSQTQATTQALFITKLLAGATVAGLGIDFARHSATNAMPQQKQQTNAGTNNNGSANQLAVQTPIKHTQNTANTAPVPAQPETNNTTNDSDTDSQDDKPSQIPQSEPFVMGPQSPQKPTPPRRARRQQKEDPIAVAAHTKLMQRAYSQEGNPEELTASQTEFDATIQILKQTLSARESQTPLASTNHSPAARRPSTKSTSKSPRKPRSHSNTTRLQTIQRANSSKSTHNFVDLHQTEPVARQRRSMSPSLRNGSSGMNTSPAPIRPTSEIQFDEPLSHHAVSSAPSNSSEPCIVITDPAQNPVALANYLQALVDQENACQKLAVAKKKYNEAERKKEWTLPMSPERKEFGKAEKNKTAAKEMLARFDALVELRKQELDNWIQLVNTPEEGNPGKKNIAHSTVRKFLEEFQSSSELPQDEHEALTNHLAAIANGLLI